jgi:hypothetical protein
MKRRSSCLCFDKKNRHIWLFLWSKQLSFTGDIPAYDSACSNSNYLHIWCATYVSSHDIFFADGLGHWRSVLSSVELVNYPKQEDDHINLLLWTWGFLLTIDIYPFFLPADVEELLARYGGLDIGNNPWYFHRRFMEPSSFINWNLHIIWTQRIYFLLMKKISLQKVWNNDCIVSIFRFLWRRSTCCEKGLLKLNDVKNCCHFLTRFLFLNVLDSLLLTVRMESHAKVGRVNYVVTCVRSHEGWIEQFRRARSACVLLPRPLTLDATKTLKSLATSSSVYITWN